MARRYIRGKMKAKKQKGIMEVHTDRQKEKVTQFNDPLI
jgi:hypothetical protein